MSRICRIGCGAVTVPAGDCTADGFWHCATCHVSFTNNATATTHETTHTGHQLAWWCHTHERLELITTPAPGPNQEVDA